jgi:F0F1-type ATP synthase membrane subunit b/b'
MTQNPFAKRSDYEGHYVARRRSTRVDWVTPVILTGRDSSGNPFQEETETVTVNLHGAKIKTQHRVMVGAQVNIENPVNVLSGKAICVSFEEAPPGQVPHAIGVQLLQPQNIWGVKNPPPDWERVLSATTGRTAAREQPGERVAPQAGTVLASAPESRTHSISAALPEAEQLTARCEQRLAELAESLGKELRRRAEEIAAETVLTSRRELDQAVAEAAKETNQRLEKSLAEVDAALETFRTESVGEIVREAVQGLQTQIAPLAADMENRLSQREQQALAELEAVREAFRTSVADELMARKNEIVEAAEQELRTRISSMLSTILST